MMLSGVCTGPNANPIVLGKVTFMADAIIDIVGVDELPLIVDMYNQIFRPAKTIESFRRRYLGRYNVLQLVARVKDKPAGFFLGFELKPDTFFAWFYGVLPDCRRMGIGSQLIEAAQSWAVHITMRHSDWSVTTAIVR